MLAAGDAALHVLRSLLVVQPASLPVASLVLVESQILCLIACLSHVCRYDGRHHRRNHRLAADSGHALPMEEGAHAYQWRHARLSLHLLSPFEFASRMLRLQHLVH